MAVIFERNLPGLTVLRAIVLLSTLVALSGCSSMAVESDWDTSVDFSVFQTFGLIENAELSVSTLVDQRIRDAIRSDLESKGLRLVDDYTMADLAVGYEVATQQRATYHTVHSGWGASGFRSSNLRLGASVGTSRTVRNEYTVGTMIIAMFRMDDKALVWEGSGSDALSEVRGPEESVQMINETVQTILNDFPPRVGAGE